MDRRRRGLFVAMCIGALMILGLSAGVVRAQEITATVSGVVADPSGAAVVGATVMVTASDGRAAAVARGL